MRLYIILMVVLMCCCSKSEEKVELEIVSDKILVSKFETGKTKNIIEYKITNYTDCNYYFNAYSLSKLTWEIKGLQPGNVFFQILDEDENHADYGQKEYLPTEKFIICKQMNYDREEKELKELNYSISPDYKNLIDKNNFLLKKGESKYFEILYYFPESNYSFVNLEKNKKYHFKMLLYSDSTYNKKFLSRPIIKTIKENNYKIYHGIIESKNTVPLKIVD
jgi:hypothetical protein